MENSTDFLQAINWLLALGCFFAGAAITAGFFLYDLKFNRESLPGRYKPEKKPDLSTFLKNLAKDNARTKR